jgi:DNA-directed RNA polymerase subunit RPC12/RpoP
MSDFKFNCAHCGQKLGCDESFAGREIACPSCKKNVVVPWPHGKPTGMTFVPESWKKPSPPPSEGRGTP